MIHPTAIISDGAEIHPSVEIAPYAIIEDNVKIGEGCKIGSTALIASGARLSKNVKIGHGAIIATEPQDLKFEGEETLANIGENTVVREYATINRGTNESGSTDVGRDCLIMTYAHVAHDCKLGDHIIMSNSVNLAGHVHIDDWAIISGLVPVHQFVHIGAHTIIGGGFRVPQDVVPYSLMGGYPLKVIGLNNVGLQRRGFSPEAIDALKKVFKILFRSGLNLSQALKKAREEAEITVEVENVLSFIENSERGVIR